ncbi:TPA: hypothetical protein U5341_000901 [Yersinia enterocolitica]|nr:hypothetical protein [Yersinia enterocolitica]
MLELQRSVCAFCRATLKPDEVYSCDKCDQENVSIEMLEEADDKQATEPS